MVVIAGLAWSAGRPVQARLAGAPLELVQVLAHVPTSRAVAWLDTGVAEGETSRGALAEAIDGLQHAGAAVIVVAQPLDQPSDGADLARVRAFLDSREALADPALRARLQEWATELDHDARLERAIAGAGTVVLRARPVEAGTAPRAGEPLAARPPYVAPLARFARAAVAVGIDPARPADADGVHRRDGLAPGDGAPPALAYAAVRAVQGAALAGGATPRPLPSSAGDWVPYYGPGALERHGIDVLRDARTANLAFTDRIVVVGSGREAVRVPGAGTLPAAEALALRVASLLDGRYALVPGWAPALGIALLALVVPWAALLAQRMRVSAALAATAGLALALLAAEVFALTQFGTWVPLAFPALTLVLATAGTLLLERRGSAVVAAPATARPPPRVAGEARPAFIAERERRPAPRPARDAPAPADSTPPYADTVPTPGPPPATQSLRDISEALRVRLEEPSRGDVADLLLGRTKRRPKPKLGRYELERELGRGAMGTVYLGRDPHINRVVAIKAIPIVEEFTEQDLAEARARFFREAEMAGRLTHPGIVTVHDAGEDAGIAWIAMEYVQGRLLSEHAVSDRLLPAAQVLELVARIADALDYAHAQDVVHRDVKPANVIFDPLTLDTKITDFGIARLTNSSATRTGIVLGTPSFMAPEQLEGRFVTGRSDLFSLGVTLFQLLAGLLPFRADSMTGLMDKIANTPHPPLRTIRPDLPPCVGLIVDKALAKDPEQRYAAGAEFAKALRACARSLRA